MAPGIGFTSKGNEGDPIISRLVDEDKVPWYKKHNLFWLYIALWPTCMGVETTSGYDSSMMNGLQSVPFWDNYFNHPRGALLGILSASYSLGAIIGLPLVPFIIDRFGRRTAILFGSSICLVGAALQTASVGFAMFLVARILMGVGIPFCIVAASSLIGELAYPKERPYLTSLFNASYFVGAIVAAGVTLGTFGMQNEWSWRIPSILQVIPSLMQICFLYFIPESPRWLVSKGREQEALDILIHYHAEGDVDSEFARAEFAQIKDTLAIEAEQSKRGWAELFNTPGMRRRVLLCSALGLFTQWSGNGVISYFLTRILENVGINDPRIQNIINLCNTVWSLINGVSIAFIVQHMRRRVAYLTCTICLVCVYTGWTAASGMYATTASHASAAATIAMIFMYSPAYNIGYNALTYTYLVEILPFTYRAKGMTIFQAWGKGAGFFNQFVNPIGIANISWRWYLTYVCWLCFEICFVYFLFPETAGRTIEELAFLYESDQRKEQTERVLRDVNAIHQGLAGDHPSLDDEKIGEKGSMEHMENPAARA